MASVVFDRRNWVFVAALVPAFLVGLFGLLPVGKQPHLISSRPAPDTSAPATTAPAASSPNNGKLLHAPSPKIVPRAPDFTVKTALQIDRPLAPGNYVWDESGVPPGRVAIVVDIKQQLIFVYRGGDEIGRSTLIYGDDDKPAPLGVFPILEKDADHHSKTYWNAPMPFMLRLTPDGVSLHGTAFIDPNYATHGCVGLPKAFAKLLFRTAKVGDYVKVTRGWNPGQ